MSIKSIFVNTLDISAMSKDRQSVPAMIRDLANLIITEKPMISLPEYIRSICDDDLTVMYFLALPYWTDQGPEPLAAPAMRLFTTLATLLMVTNMIDLTDQLIKQSTIILMSTIMLEWRARHNEITYALDKASLEDIEVDLELVKLTAKQPPEQNKDQT